MSETTTKENNGMDTMVVSSLITLATQIASVAIRYNDPNLQAPTPEAVLAHLEEFKKLAPLPETYDVGFVDNIMGQVHNWIGSAKA